MHNENTVPLQKENGLQKAIYVYFNASLKIWKKKIPSTTKSKVPFLKRNLNFLLEVC